MERESLKKIIIRSLTLYSVLMLVIAVICYYLLPLMLSYPPESINNEFEKNIDEGYSYFSQYVLAVIVAVILSNANIFLELKRVKGWEKLNKDNETDKAKLAKIKKICFSAPSRLYLLYAIVPPISVFFVLLLTGAKIQLATNLAMTILVFFILVGLLIYIFSKRMFDHILIKIGNLEKGSAKIVLGYKGRIFFQFLPLTIVVGFIAYTATKLVYYNEMSDLLHNEYKNQLNNSISTCETLDQAKEQLQLIEKQNETDTVFIIEPYAEVYSEGFYEISDFVIKYTFLVGENGKTYGYYASGIQGTYLLVDIQGKIYAVGILYEMHLPNMLLVLGLTILGLSTIIVAFLWFFAKDIADTISKVSDSMKLLTEGTSIDYDKKIPVTANDELGELTVNFNKILDLEKEHIETIKEKQEALVESGRLSSLGQMIGGIAHNLKTPIMSISGTLQGIQDLITEYHSSVGDPEVTEEDHKAIASDMQDLVDKTRVYLTYMSDIITAVKGQAVQMDSSETQVFGILEVLNRIDVLMKHELKSALIEMVTNVAEEAKTSFIRGDINSLVQVINNLIQNSIYSYEGRKNETIDLTITKEGKIICLKLQDYGCGIPENVKEKLFKEMITTKGKNGTGLGLYMSYSTIKGKFGGDFTFESEQGKGTTFYIKIPTV